MELGSEMELRDRGAKYQTFTNGVEHRGAQDDKAEQKATFTVEEAVDHIGFGRFQLKISFVAGFSWIADSMEIMVLSILGPVLLCEWRLNSTQEALITTVVFIGFMVGAPLFGFIADIYGRKTSLLLGASWALFYGIISGLSPSYVWLLILRCLTGVAIGGVPQSVTYYSELLPQKIRGRCIILLEIYWALGAVLEVGLALLILVPYGWRYWLFASAFPLLLFIPMFSFLPESPRYCLISGRYEEAVTILSNIASVNRTSLPPGKLEKNVTESRGNIYDLFTSEYRRTTILLWIIWFAGGFCYYGIVLLCTELIRLGTTCVLPVYLAGASQCYLNCKSLTYDDYIELLWTSVAEIPGLILTAACVDTLGRKLTMGLEFFIFMIILFLMFICQSGAVLTLSLFIARALAASALQVVYVYTPEVYPTYVRAIGLGWACGAARIGAIITPFVAQVLLHTDIRACLAVYACVGLLGAICTVLLPIETLGRDMSESNREEK